MTTAEYVAIAKAVLEAAKTLTCTIAAETARFGDGAVMTNEGPVAVALHELKTALQELEQADKQILSGGHNGQ